MPQNHRSVPPVGVAIVWFRDDLRLHDHPALTAAVRTGRPVLTLFVHDEDSPGIRPLGGASKWWLARSLARLAEDLERSGSSLHILSGPATEMVPKLAADCQAAAVFWSRRHRPAERAVDDAIEAALRAAGIEVQTFGGSLWHEPDEILQKAGDWYRIYTPYWRQASALPLPPGPLPAPHGIDGVKSVPQTLPWRLLDDLGLQPRKPDWSSGLAATFTPGETQARARLALFVQDGLDDYGEARNLPAIDGSSQLSPHLRFGEVSPREVIHAVDTAARHRKTAAKSEKYLQEIVWRDFAYNLLAHVPDLSSRSYSPRFEHFRWAEPSQPLLAAWQHGRTGYPIVDAGMRQLWQTGWMHNRVRMITASFLCKHLLVDWRVGEDWFWDTLCDADPANNAVNWQWVAGTGPDAAPFFRIFNPVTQGEKFDPDGTYVRRFVPELAALAGRWIQRPWEAPAAVLAEAGVVLGKTYPGPIVDHVEARQRALAAFAASRATDREPTSI